jgi:hypothetical protein
MKWQGDSMNFELVYSTIRDEILEQKKCQFQLFSVSVAVTSAILAYAAGAHLGRLVYIAPMLINVISLWMVLEKAISVQRKVGYLQLIEQTTDYRDREWSWETDLDRFREKQLPSKDVREAGKHKYVLQVSLLLLFLNGFCAALFFFGPDSRSNTVADGWINEFCLLVLVAGVVLATVQWCSLAYGKNSTPAILRTWKSVVLLRSGGDALPNVRSQEES